MTDLPAKPKPPSPIGVLLTIVLVALPVLWAIATVDAMIRQHELNPELAMCLEEPGDDYWHVGAVLGETPRQYCEWRLAGGR